MTRLPCIPVVVIDYRQFPLENTVPGTILLGRLFGQEALAQEIVDFYLQQVNADCCRTYGSSNLGLMVERAEGINLGTDLLPGWSGTLNAEQIFVSDPDVIIATGSNWFTYNPEGDFVSLGYFVEPEDARMRLKALGEKRPGWTELRALNEGRRHVPMAFAGRRLAVGIRRSFRCRSAPSSQHHHHRNHPTSPPGGRNAKGRGNQEGVRSCPRTDQADWTRAIGKLRREAMFSGRRDYLERPAAVGPAFAAGAMGRLH